MTPSEANKAVNSIKLKLIQLIYDVDAEHEHDVQAIIDEVTALEQSLKIRHVQGRTAPNCRPATQEELESLCQSSNVVMFPAVA
jgi:hypothetical protein